MNTAKSLKGFNLFDVFNHLLMLLILVVTIYPFLYTLSVSLSDEYHVLGNEVTFYPKGFNLKWYELVFRDTIIWRGYRNSVVYTIVGTAISTLLTFATAYPLARKNLPFRNIFTFIFAFTMFFGGGLIPTFVVVKSLGMYNTMWALIIPGAIGTWNMLLVRNFIMETIPPSLEESALIDGASEIKILFLIVIPLSIPILAVIILFYGIGQWNSYFNSMVYLRDDEKYPLQLVLRKILVDTDLRRLSQIQGMEEIEVSESLKDAVIMVSILPILIAYPFVQKHFVKGIMIGSIKG